MITPSMLVSVAVCGEPPKPLVEYPHPLITEVLYAVPTGPAGDANADGKREANGDEFIELVNPHDKPIQLRGYVLSGKGPRPGSDGAGGQGRGRQPFTQLKFTFPALELQPGEVVVVFNGHGQSWKGPVGDSSRAPRSGNELFHGAKVFTMRVESARLGLANNGDMVLLTAPGGPGGAGGEKVQCISWGTVEAPGGAEGVKLVERASAEQGSITRETIDGGLVPHPEIEGVRFSPGKFPAAAEKPGESEGG
jgi:hypothetical protein